MNKQIILFLIISVLSSQLALADFTLEVEELNSTILPFESASYQITVTNDAEEDDVINIYADATNWILSPQTIVADEPETVHTLLITPRSGVGLSNYRVPLAFESQRTGQSEALEVLLSISLDLLSQSYPVNINLEVDAVSEVDPREPFEVKIFLKNNNLREIENLDVAIDSALFSEELQASLQPLAPYRKTLLFELDPLQDPGRYDLSVVVTNPDDGTVLAQDLSVYEITGYAEITQNLELVEDVFFKTVEEITLVNDGNEDRTRSVSVAASSFDTWFISTTPEAEFIEDKLVWQIALGPQESTEITVTRNYRPIAYTIIVIILLIIAYFLLRSPIVILKQAQVTAADKQGSSAMKVRVFIKNRSGKTIHTLKVIDRIPRIASLIEDKSLGTLQPSKVTKSEKKGTILRWEIESLEPYEERIISYKLKSKLKIVGAMSLPEARVKFETGNGRERISASGMGRRI